MIYLDQCALFEVMKDNEAGHRFRALFADHGELLLSSINLFELARLRGASLERAQRFLTEVVGCAWIPIEFDATAVATRELEGKFSPSPAISRTLVDDACATEGAPSLEKLVSVAARTERPKDLEATAFAKQELARQIRELRAEHVRDPSFLDRRYPSIPLTRRTRTLSTLARVFRIAIQGARGGSGFEWELNDAEDMVHAVIGLAHAHVAVLDGKWARRVTNFGLARVFGCGEWQSFLDWYERFHPA
jgi:hypothetical protein